MLAFLSIGLIIIEEFVGIVSTISVLCVLAMILYTLLHPCYQCTSCLMKMECLVSILFFVLDLENPSLETRVSFLTTMLQYSQLTIYQ